MQDSRLFVAVADGKRGKRIQPKVVNIGEAKLISGRWHALVLSHRRSSALRFSKDHLEASSFIVALGCTFKTVIITLLESLGDRASELVLCALVFLLQST